MTKVKKENRYKKGNKLTLKEQEFTEELAETGNATEAIRRVYNLGSNGGSKTLKQRNTTARAMGSHKLAKKEIQEELAVMIKRLKIDKPSRVKRLGKMFNTHKDPHIVIDANKEISKLLGDYQPDKIIGLFDRISEMRDDKEE